MAGAERRAESDWEQAPGPMAWREASAPSLGFSGAFSGAGLAPSKGRDRESFPLKAVVRPFSHYLTFEIDTMVMVECSYKLQMRPDPLPHQTP